MNFTNILGECREGVSHLPGDPSFRFFDRARGGYEAVYFFRQFYSKSWCASCYTFTTVTKEKPILSTSKLHAYAPAVTMQLIFFSSIASQLIFFLSAPAVTWN